MARLYLHSYGDGPVVVTRAPGRVNLMGRHVDHQGGHCNMLAIEPDVYVMAGAGSRGLLRLRNVDGAKFAASDVPLDELLVGYRGGDWTSYVGSSAVRDRARAASGAWHYYMQAALARLAAAAEEGPSPANGHSPGMDAVVAGNVPVAAGLSSSSAVVVAGMEAALELFGLDVAAERLVTLCSEAEWYVGTRGGAGDQAAMKFGRRDAVVKLSFLPLRVEGTAPWPDGFTLLVADSLQEARKSDGARNRFNQRVACYHIGREMLLRLHPELRERVEHLRDLTPHRLQAPDHRVAEMLVDLPRSMRREGVSSAVGDDLAERLLVTHDCGADPYPVRSVTLFGIAECERSRKCADLLTEGCMEEIGRLMNVSHNGDRVASDLVEWPWSEGMPYDDDEMCEVVRRCRGAETLADQPGGYACSTPRIDAMVDIALSVPGVLGAQLSGAGLGGCMMALMRDTAVEAVKDALQRVYYAPRSLEPRVIVCRPVAGCGRLQL